VAVSGDIESDDCDALGPTYLIHRTDEGAVGGCARLLPATGPYMLRKSFSVLAHAGTRPHWPAQFHHPNQRFHGPFSHHLD
jgi:acyl homoserine lactone synthase